MLGKRQHYVSRAYLARFARSDGRVIVHRLGRPSIPIHPVNVAVEQHYNSVPGVDDKPDPTPERLITEYFDTPLTTVLHEIDAGTTLESESRVRLALFVVFQHYRCPALKRRLKQRFSSAAQEMLEELVEDPEAIRTAAIDAGIEITAEMVSLMPDLVRAGQITASATNAPWLDFAFQAAREIAPRLVNERSWMLCRGPSGFKFVTSDNPVQHLFFEDQSHMDDMAVWLSPNTITLFPIDPSRCILIRRRIGANLRQQLTHQQAKDVNRALILGSSRMVFSQSNDPFIQTILAKRSASKASEWAA